MSQTKPTNYPALSTLVTVFFFWGFIAAGNSVFIPFCKSYFGLDQFQSQLIDFAFYLAYYLGALMLFVFGSMRGKDLVGHWGYKRSIVYGLLFSALGAAAMIIAVELNTFAGMLMGLFIVALGFSLQQTGANPFAILLGDRKTGATRVNLGGAINSLGTTIGPVIIALALFGSAAAVSDEQIKSLPLSKVVILYVFVGALFLGAAALFGFSKKVPDGKNAEEPEKAGSAINGLLIITGLLILAFVPVFNSYRYDYSADGLACIENQRMLWLFAALAVIAIGLPLCNGLAQKNKKGWGAMQYPQLVYGMLAIFVYVGVEVAIGSNLGELLKQKEFGGYEASQIAPFIAMYWGGLMIGRWTGAIAAFDLKKSTQTLLKFVVPLIAFGIILTVITLAGYDATPLYWFILCVLVQILAAYLTKDQPIKTLSLFGVLGIVAMLIGLFTEGKVAVYAFLSGGLACSIMWPCIFTLAIAGLGKYTTQGSAFLIMMILGGAIIPPIQGKLSDILGIQESFFIPVLCFAYLAFYAWFAGRTLKNQGIDYEE